MLKASSLRVVWVWMTLCAAVPNFVLAQSRIAVKDTAHDVRAMHASVLVMDVASGRTLSSLGDVDVRSKPGSVLKPLVLTVALRAHIVTERDTVACRGTLTVAGHNLACSHPRDLVVLDAREALANSCNTYFATLARRMPAETLTEGLRSFGVLPSHVPHDADDRVLMVLGLESITVSPSSLANAYRQLALAMSVPGDHAARAVEEGMLQSVRTGMAHAANVKDVALGGKTGTVDDSGGRSHGWFAGIVFDAEGRAQRVVIVFTPTGNGNDAATLAKRVVVDSRGAR